MSSPKYVVITPVRNEGKRIGCTIESMVAQTLLPAAWVIIDDGSTDDTGAVVDEAANRHSWIKAVHRRDRGFRKPGAGVIEAFYDGYDQVRDLPWEFLGKLDGDLEFGPRYFEESLEFFERDPKLGIGGGKVFCRKDGQLYEECPEDPAFHVRGATKVYRRKTWEEIGGLFHLTGWDTLDELKANMLGWHTYSFTGVVAVQLKHTGAADGTWKNWYKNGRANYITGYHPLFMVIKCARRLFKGSSFLATLALLSGYFGSYVSRPARVDDPELIRYLRHQQVNRIFGRRSLWSDPAPVVVEPARPQAPAPTA
jgi:glycosyltransferase involved in cell wall biosynthesis